MYTGRLLLVDLLAASVSYRAPVGPVPAVSTEHFAARLPRVVRGEGPGHPLARISQNQFRFTGLTPLRGSPLRIVAGQAPPFVSASVQYRGLKHTGAVSGRRILLSVVRGLGPQYPVGRVSVIQVPRPLFVSIQAGRTAFSTWPPFPDGRVVRQRVPGPAVIAPLDQTQALRVVRSVDHRTAGRVVRIGQWHTGLFPVSAVRVQPRLVRGDAPSLPQARVINANVWHFTPAIPARIDLVQPNVVRGTSPPTPLARVKRWAQKHDGAFVAVAASIHQYLPRVVRGSPPPFPGAWIRQQPLEPGPMFQCVIDPVVSCAAVADPIANPAAIEYGLNADSAYQPSSHNIAQDLACGADAVNADLDDGSDATGMQTTCNPDVNNTLLDDITAVGTFRLDSIADPGAGSGVTVAILIRTWISAKFGTPDVFGAYAKIDNLQLFQGDPVGSGTVVASFSNAVDETPGSTNLMTQVVTEFSLVLSDAEVDSITDWADLWIHCKMQGESVISLGAYVAYNTIDVTKLALSVDLKDIYTCVTDPTANCTEVDV